MSSRRDAVAETARSLGGELECFYLAFGDHDAYVVVDLPDNEAAAALRAMVAAVARASMRQRGFIAARTEAPCRTNVAAFGEPCLTSNESTSYRCRPVTRAERAGSMGMFSGYRRAT